MSLQRILEHWPEYDDKTKKRLDANDFSCTESWEVKYLLDKIKNTFPELREDVIRQAIEYCCLTVKAPRPRVQFVTCVLRRLGKGLQP